MRSLCPKLKVQADGLLIGLETSNHLLDVSHDQLRLRKLDIMIIVGGNDKLSTLVRLGELSLSSLQI